MSSTTSSTDLRKEGFAVIVWGPGDVATLRPEWSEAECAAALDRNRRQLEDRSVELGWEVLETLLDMDDAEEPE